MARKSGKRGSAIILLMIVGALASGSGTASAGVGTSRGELSASVPVAPAALPTLGIGLDPVRASWAEASWAEE